MQLQRKIALLVAKNKVNPRIPCVLLKNGSLKQKGQSKVLVEKVENVVTESVKEETLITQEVVIEQEVNEENVQLENEVVTEVETEDKNIVSENETKSAVNKKLKKKL